MRYSLDDLTEALEWGPKCLEVAANWRSQYVALLRDRFSSWTEQGQACLLQRSMELLTVDEQDEVLLSPDVAWRLLDRKSLGIRYALSRELLRALDENDKLRNGQCEKVAGVLVDYSSAHSYPRTRPNADILVPLSSQDRAALSPWIESAVAGFSSVAPFAFRFVQTCTSRIVFRIDPESSMRVGSHSFRGYAGITLISNAHVCAAKPLRLIDAIVHEAIHAALLMYEPLVEPLCHPYPSDLRVESCWSGTQLTLDSYVQACFVWWGLYNLWSRWPSSDQHTAKRDAHDLKLRAQKGFAAHPVKHLLNKVGTNYFPDRTILALSRIEEAFRLCCKDHDTTNVAHS